MAEKRLFTDEQLEYANNVNIISYAQSNGLEIKQISPNSYKIPGYGGLNIDADGHKWCWFSQDEGGGPIQFVMTMENKPWVEAVKILLGMENTVEYNHQPVRKKEKVEFIPPEKNDTFKHIFAYLIKGRGIDKDIVGDFVKDHSIYENKMRSCVFIGRDDEGVTKFASVRSTNTIGKRFRGDIAGSDKRFSFHREGTSNNLYINEAPIDMMSRMTILKAQGHEDYNTAHFLSLGCTASTALDHYLEKYPNIDTIYCGLDLDEAGHKAYLKLLEERPNLLIKSDFPKEKDWNKTLLKHLSLPIDEGEFELPTQYKVNMKVSNNQVFFYLSDTHSVHPDVTSWYINQGKLYESVFHNCVFIGKRSRKQSKIGLHSEYKYSWTNS